MLADRLIARTARYQAAAASLLQRMAARLPSRSRIARGTCQCAFARGARHLDNCFAFWIEHLILCPVSNAQRSTWSRKVSAGVFSARISVWSLVGETAECWSADDRGSVHERASLDEHVTNQTRVIGDGEGHWPFSCDGVTCLQSWSWKVGRRSHLRLGQTARWVDDQN